jgi:CheY-like chemotaxis protein
MDALIPITTDASPAEFPKGAVMGQSTPLPRVLIVEDYDDARDSLCQLLGFWGYNCQAAADGPAALKAAAGFLPDVVLMDIGLPKMDGYEVTRAMRNLPGMSGAVFVAVTGYGHLSGKARSADDGFLTYMVKPVEPDDLRELLTHCASLRSAVPVDAGLAAPINLSHSVG